MTLGIAPLERASAEAYFAARPKHCGAEASSPSAWIHEQILDATFDETPQILCKRRLAISTAGVPIVYSHKCTASGTPRFRLLAEPGGTGCTVEEQVAVSRALIHTACEGLHWYEAPSQVNAVLDRLLPSDPDAYAAWHGGLGIGLEIGADGPELRVYCNVRHGDIAARWQRFADAAAQLGGNDARTAVHEIRALAGPRAVPAGLALALERGVIGLRVYLGLIDATAESAIGALPPALTSSASSIRAFVEAFRGAFGELAPQDITLAYDFAVREGVLLPQVARFKVDVFCELVSQRERARLISWAERQLAARGLDPAGLYDFLAGLDEAFGGSTLQYLSLGCRHGEDELTAYCIPGDAGQHSHRSHS